ncbi:MAG: hypothetical protein IJL93_05960 [Bacteroidales bacterium]|nr:hypothetical protein [Bacteroidales bacterium]
MAFGFKFWHIPEHRVFHYEPRYYDERKEKLEEIYKKYGKTMPGEEIEAMAKKEGLIEEDSGRRYIPGMHIRGSFRRTYEEKRLSEEKEASAMSLVKKVVLALTLVALAAAAYYLSKGFILLLVQ